MKHLGLLVRCACVCLLAVSLAVASGQRVEAAGVTQFGKSHVVNDGEAIVLAKKDGKDFKNNKGFKGKKDGKKFKKKDNNFKDKKVKNKKVKNKKVKNKKVKNKKTKKVKKKG